MSYRRRHDYDGHEPDWQDGMDAVQQVCRALISIVILGFLLFLVFTCGEACSTIAPTL